MDNAAEKVIKTWKGPENTTVNILASSHLEQKTFTRFAGHWTELSTAIRWTDSSVESELPGFALKENIIYSALPMAQELSPFLRGLETIAAPVLDPESQALADKIDLPCTLTLYVALQCPHCPAMVDTLIPLAAATPNIHLHIIDGSLFTERAQADQVMAAPCLILDNDFRWTGNVSATEILTMILDRDPARLSADTLKNILEAGDALWICDQMIQSDKIFPGFIDLMRHDTWSVRLGAMVVVEALAEKAPELGLTLIPALVRAFNTKEVSTQGDILYALGEIGNLETKAWILEQSAHLAHEDLIDAAKDAIEAIESRFSR